MSSTAPQSQHRGGLVTAVEFSRGEWVVTLTCPLGCTAETCSNFGTAAVIGRGGGFPTAQAASAYREEMHRKDPALARLTATTGPEAQTA